MVFHVIDAAEDTPTSLPDADDTGVVFRFVTSAVLLAGEPAASRLGATVVAAEEMLAVTVEMLP